MAKGAQSAEAESAMDYAEHDRTYKGFLWLTRWTIAGVVSLLLAMLAGFFGGFGLVGGILVFIILMIVSFFFV